MGLGVLNILTHAGDTSRAWQQFHPSLPWHRVDVALLHKASTGQWEGLPLLLLEWQLERIMRSPFIFGGHLHALGKRLLAFGAPHSAHWQ